MNKYPRIGRLDKANPHTKPGDGKPCVICQTPTTGKAHIQVSPFRGEDEVEPCCDKCQIGNRSVLLGDIVKAWELEI